MDGDAEAHEARLRDDPGDPGPTREQTPELDGDEHEERALEPVAGTKD